ncbi:MAG: Maf family protein [Thiobacillaceae bacterium]
MPMSKQLYLASQSPRRLELLRQIGLAPTVLPLRQTPPRADVDETPLVGEKAWDYVTRLARLKAQAALRAVAGRRLLPWPIVAADTSVTLDGDILGKPRDAAEASAWLRRYSGRSHTVLTAVAVAHQDLVRVAVSESTVRFGHLSEQEIARYVASGEPFDKAGGYGIQGLAAAYIEHLAGSYSGVMGLPLYETVELLKRVGFDAW